LNRRISVIIPVYNAFAEAKQCLESVLKYCRGIDEILIIDDASTEGDFREYFSSRKYKSSVLKISRNEVNLGFVKSCNLGMRDSSDSDVILLNSDTIVCAGWVNNLKHAAYSRENVGTVTPLTNNGTICSIPEFAAANEIPPGYTVDEFAELVAKCSNRFYIELPTCVGFCVFIKRTLLERVGYFDEEAFGLGYGEENDFSCRAQKAGFVDIIDDATYVYHRGNCSFGKKQKELAERNSKVLRDRHPHYFDNVAKFCSQNPLSAIHSRILDEMVVREWSRGKSTALHILQNGPFKTVHGPLGGTELNAADLITNNKELFHWSLVPTRQYYRLSAHLEGGFERVYFLNLASTSLATILHEDLFDLIHLHHSRYYDHNEITLALSKHPNYLVSFHDFILVCPRFHLYTPFRKICSGYECVKSCGYRQPYIDTYRENTKKLLSNAKKLICFSDSTKNYITNILSFNYSSWQKEPHGIILNDGASESSQSKIPTRPDNDNPFKVLLLGYIPQHKGSLIVEELVKLNQLPNGVPIEYHVLGKLFSSKKGNIVEHGEYKKEEVFWKIRKISAHIVLILSICPETYSLTLDEAWNAGIPALVTPFGALPERVKASGAGWVLSDLKPETVIAELNKITGDWGVYERAYKALNNTKIISVEDEAKNYKDLYATQLLSRSRNDITGLLEYLKNFGLERAPKKGKMSFLTGKVLSVLVYTLDALHVRPLIQHVAVKLLPPRIYRVLKSYR